MYDKRKKHEKGKRKFKEEGKTGYGDLSANQTAQSGP
jgi:hypothetical protein